MLAAWKYKSFSALLHIVESFLTEAIAVGFQCSILSFVSGRSIIFNHRHLEKPAAPIIG
jgi:hypothetical protein